MNSSSGIAHLGFACIMAFAPSAAQGQDGGSAPAAPNQVTAANTGATYKISDRVDVNYDGTWYHGSILAVRDGKYRVMRDDYSNDFRWFAAEDLRPLAPATRKMPVPITPLPRQVPTGSYVCTTITSGFYSSSSTGSTFGTMRVTGPGAYTGLAMNGSGAASRFTYDPRSGSIEWEGSTLKGFFGKVIESRFGLDTQRVPYINVTYRVREGGSLFDLSCRRETAA